MSIMNDDLFTYEVEISGLANVPCDLNKGDDSEQQMTHGSDNNMEYDPTNVEFTNGLLQNLYHTNNLIIIRRMNNGVYGLEVVMKVELVNRTKNPLILFGDFLTKDIDGFKIYEEYKDDWIYEWNKDVSWVHWKNPLCWKEDDYCNGGNLPGAYIVRNRLRYQDLEWHEALKDNKLKEEALKNKAIMEGIIDEDDESSNEGWRSGWFSNIRRFEIDQYSYRGKTEYVVVKENEYDDLTSTSKEAIHAYQEIFRMMDEGWMVTRAE
ncbi:hypothetical protein Tco_0950922 [Tanacetum coccineum]|uniref:Uncharacterized protein n=1 Tax=Tanacetum coccineum TaxID=301880 RepID=A0ABQ5DSP5_9ASTR